MKHALTGLLALLVVAFDARPGAVTAAARAGAPDVAHLDAFVSAQVQRHGLPGMAVGIVEGDRIVHLRGFGKADQTGRAVTPQTPFLLASMSKPLTALAIMQLVDAGTVELDAPVQRYVPDFRVADPIASAQITVRHLLQHTSGLPVTACDTRGEAETLAQFVAELRTVQLAAPPGARHTYCSGNYNVLGRVVETVSGESYATYVQRHVFAPLEMRHSFASEPEAQRDGMAQGYRWLFGLPTPAHERYNTSQLPSGYLIASAEDMTHFLIAQLNGGRFGSTTILSPESIAAMQAPGVPIGPGRGTYGLGWKTAPLGGIPVLQHYGDNPYFHGVAFLEPQNRRGAVLLMNSNGAVPLASAFTQIEEGVARLLVGEEPAPASPLSVGRLYLIVDGALAGLFVLALWPLLRLPRWAVQLRQRHSARRPGLGWVGLRLVGEAGLPALLLLGVRLFIGNNLGAQSWGEIFVVFPDFTLWLWGTALLVLLTGALRLALTVRVLRRNAALDVRPNARGPRTVGLPGPT